MFKSGRKPRAFKRSTAYLFKRDIGYGLPLDEGGSRKRCFVCVSLGRFCRATFEADDEPRYRVGEDP